MEFTRKSEQTTALDTAVMAVMKDVDYVKKDGTNQQQQYKFASAENIIAEVRAAALKHKLIIGVSYTSVVDLETGQTKSGSAIYRCRVSCDITLRHGPEFEVHTFFGEGADSGDKALPKAKTMCLKQALRQLFLIETGEADADRETPPETVKKDSAEKRIASLPRDIKDGFAWLKQQPEHKTTHAATYRSGVLLIMDANNDDPEALRAYLKDKGYSFSMPMQGEEGMP